MVRPNVKTRPVLCNSAPSRIHEIIINKPIIDNATMKNSATKKATARSSGLVNENFKIPALPYFFYRAKIGFTSHVARYMGEGDRLIKALVNL